MTSFEKVDHYRVEMGWSGAELMRQLGLSSGVYSQWKTGKQNPNLANLKKMSELFHVSVSDLLDDEGNKKTATSGDGTSAVDKLMEIIPTLTSQQAEFLLPQVLGLISSQQDQGVPK